MSDPRRTRATRLLVLRAVRDRLTAVDSAERTAARAEFDQPGTRDMGVITVGGDDVQIGAVQLTKGSVSWRVTDPAALLAWVKANRPSEIETVESVRDSYKNALLMQARKEDAPVTNDGELVPGIEKSEGSPTLTVKPSDDAGDLIAQAFADGTLSLATFIAPAVEARP